MNADDTYMDFVANAPLFPGDVVLISSGPSTRKRKRKTPMVWEGIGRVLAYGSYGFEAHLIFRELEGDEMVGEHRICPRSQVYLLEGENILKRIQAWNAKGWLEIGEVVCGDLLKKLKKEKRRKECEQELNRRYLEAKRLESLGFQTH